jgi:hypothetical protein
MTPSEITIYAAYACAVFAVLFVIVAFKGSKA